MSEHSAPSQRHSPTSRAAATWADASGLADTARGQVLRLLVAAGSGLTDEQIADELCMSPSTERPRRIELVRDGLVVAGGYDLTRSGRTAVRWWAARRS